MEKKFKNQKGMSLAEVLVATIITTIIMGAAYVIYNNFQGTFVRQLGHNNVKQEARFALHTLQYDSRLAGYKHPDSEDGEVQNPVTVLDDGIEVADSEDPGNAVKFCFDTVNPAGTPPTIRKLVRYELKTPNSSETEKTILKKMINNPGKTFSREDIGQLINLDKERSIDVIITRLRKKIEIDPKNPKFLQTIRGAGYVLWIE